MRRSLAAASLTLFCAHLQAAGGHFDVDDASVLAPGQCQVEVWALRAPAAATSALHLGPGCRVGPVELSLNAERLLVAGDGRSGLGPQLKWAVDPLVGKLAAGLVWGALFDLTNHGRPAQTLYVPLTWQATESLWFHANLGVDRDAEGSRWRRQGVSGEWAASDSASFIAERAKIGGAWTTRVGGRYSVSETLSIDLSAARVGPRADRVYVIGLNQEFAR